MLKDYYIWSCELKDGTVINQFDEKGKELSVVNDLEDNHIKYFRLVPQREGIKEIVVSFNQENLRLIYFRRIVGNTGGEFPEFHLYRVGWQTTIHNKNIKMIHNVFPDGTIETTTGDGEPTKLDDFIEVLKKTIKEVTK